MGSCAAVVATVMVGLGGGACDRPSSPTGPLDAAPSAAPSVTPRASARTPRQLPIAQERVDIPGGSFLAGSRPGRPDRNPEIEPRPHRVELGPFQIDKLPYPNDPRQPPLVGVTHDEAKRRCAERGARLCTELEWERACQGPAGDEYPSGAAWHAECGEGADRCASGFEVLGLGTAIREWTASEVLADTQGSIAVRGGGKLEGPGTHRCARRDAVEPDATATDLGFRCCSGAPNAAKVPEPTLGKTFRKLDLSAARLTALLASHPRTKGLATDVKFFREPDGADTVVARGPGDRKGFSFTVAPLVWNPAPGVEYLLVSARSGERTSFIVTYRVAGPDDYELTASFIMKNEPGPIAFAYADSIRPRLHFSDCWGCPGETGKILFRKPDSVAILQP